MPNAPHRPDPAGSAACGLHSRRAVLRGGGKAAMAATLGSLVLPAAAHAIDWSELFGKRMPDIGGKVMELSGQAFADGRPLSVGSEVQSGAVVKVVSGGRAAIALQDGSIFTVYGGSELELLLNRMSQGILNLLAGALLLVVNSGGRYLVAGSTSTFGIKGTVVYRQLFAPTMTQGRASDGLVRLPPGYSEYFCTCNGESEVLLTGRTTPFDTTSAQYHSAFYVNPADPTRRLRAPQLNHRDEEIRHLVDMQPGQKHDVSWLKA